MSSSAITPEELGSLSPALLAQIPAATPPSGVQPNFTNPETRVPVILGVGIAFLVLAISCYSIRIYTKVSAKRWSWDDCE